MVADSPSVKVWQDTHPEHYMMIEALLAPVTKEYYSFAVRQGDPVFSYLAESIYRPDQDRWDPGFTQL